MFFFIEYEYILIFRKKNIEYKKCFLQHISKYIHGGTLNLFHCLNYYVYVDIIFFKFETQDVSINFQEFSKQ